MHHAYKRPAAGLALIAAMGLLAGCDGPPDTDLTGPRVVQVLPAGPLIDTTATFTVTFSEAIAIDRVTDETGHIALSERVEVTEAFVSDIDNPPLSDSRADDVVPITLDWSDDNLSLTVTPTLALRPGTPYALVISRDVRDTSGNPLVGATGTRETFVYEITTDAGPPEVVSTTASGTVPPNIKKLRLRFNQPVQGVGRDTLVLAPTAGGDRPDIEAVLVSADRTEAEIVLADVATCERLLPGVEYRLSIEAGIVDDAGREMPAQSFTFQAGGACDLLANEITTVEAFAYDETAIILFSSTKASTTELRYGASFEDLDCGGDACPVLGPDARTVVDGRYLHEVQATGLALGQTYAFTVYAEDDLGTRAQASGSFQVVELPDIALNELLPNPDGDEAAGEFIELVNYGTEGSVRLAGWQIQIEDKTPCVFGADAPELFPGDFVVIARSDFDENAWPNLDPLDIYRADSASGCTASALTLSNQVQVVRLLDEADRPVSVYPGSPDLNPTDTHEGESIDRIAPEAPDTATSFCFADGPPTPGSTNSAVISGCQQ
jgi:hypothetical protein